MLAGLPAEVEDLKGLPDDEVMARAAEADAILLGARFRLDATRLESLRRCRVVVRYGVGFDNVDVEAAERLGIAVATVPDYCVEEVATHAIALLLALHRRLVPYADRARQGLLGIEPEHPIRRLSGLTLGVVGFGRIGRETARHGAALGLHVVAADPFLTDPQIAAGGAEPRGLDALLREADFVSLHVPLTAETRHLLDDGRLAEMKPGAIVINVGRGGLVDEDALAAAILSGHLGGAGLDVTTVEPLPPGHPLHSAPNTILTPHVAWYSTEAQLDLQRLAAEEVARVLRGEAPRSPAYR